MDFTKAGTRRFPSNRDDKYICLRRGELSRLPTEIAMNVSRLREREEKREGERNNLSCTY